MHKVYCVKWKCESAPRPRPPLPRPPLPSTSGKCVGSYSTAWSCTDEHGHNSSQRSNALKCSNKTTETDCYKPVYIQRVGFRIVTPGWHGSTPPSYGGTPLGEDHFANNPWVNNPAYSSYWERDSAIGDVDIINSHGTRIGFECTNPISIGSIPFCHTIRYTESTWGSWDPYWEWDFSVEPACLWQSWRSCSSLNQTECGKQSWCTRTSWTSSSPIPPRPSPGTGKKLWWVKQVNSEMPRGWMSLFSVSASTHEIWGVRTDWKWNCYDRHDNYIGKESYPGAWDCPVVHESYSQLIEWEDEEQPWETRPSGWIPPPPPTKAKVARCVDDKWNVHPNFYCANAGSKPVCDAEWACAVPTQPGTQWCSNPTTKDSTSLCAQKNDIEKCNNTLEVVKHCLSSRRNCASDQYRFAWGPEMAIKATISGEVAKSLKWNPSFNLYFSDLPGEEPFWYELLGACVRGEPKASVSCKSISWRYDSYCSTQRDKSSCETVNIYEKKDALSWPITVWLFKHSGQCSVSMYKFNDWEKQDSSSCPSIHKKFFKYVDSCERSVRKEVICQSKSSKAILDDSSCDIDSKPDYNMVCWWKEFPSMPSTPPTPSTPSTTALYMLYYDPYKWLDEQQLKQCRQSWTCLTNCSIVWSFAKIYDDQYWWGSRKALSTEFFCAHGPQWGAKPYTIKPIYIKGDWRANRYLGTSLSSYSFWLDADHTIPAPDGVYNTNLTSAHASDANESFYEEKVHWMKILNGKIQYNEVIQQK